MRLPNQWLRASAVVLLLLISTSAPGQVGHGKGIVNSWQTVGGYVHALDLYQKVGNEYRLAAVAEFQGTLQFNDSGIVSGIDGLLRFRLVGKESNWVPITERKLVGGKAVITTEDGKTYTIFNPGVDNWAAQIASGDIAARRPKSGVVGK